MSIPSATEFRKAYEKVREENKKIVKLKSDADFIPENQKFIIETCRNIIKKNMAKTLLGQQSNAFITFSDFVWIHYQIKEKLTKEYLNACYEPAKQELEKNGYNVSFEAIETRYNKHFCGKDPEDWMLECKIKIYIEIP
jgi:hypothetical protein